MFVRLSLSNFGLKKNPFSLTVWLLGHGLQTICTPTALPPPTRMDSKAVKFTVKNDTWFGFRGI